MCGIFGYQLKAKDYNIARKLASILLYISQERGREASGISIKTKSINKIIKKDISGSLLTQTKYYQTFFDHLDKNLDLENDFISVIGQCRLITNGRSFIEKFNQPVSYDKLSLIHNGIILNPDEMIDQLLGNEVNKKKRCK